MDTLQREQIHAVMRLAGEGAVRTDALAPDPLIRASRSRCVHQHGLDPTRLQEAVILPTPRMREHQERVEKSLHIARHGLEALYQQVAGMGYCVLLTDSRCPAWAGAPLNCLRPGGVAGPPRREAVERFLAEAA